MQEPETSQGPLLKEWLHAVETFQKTARRDIGRVMAGCPPCHFPALEQLNFAIEQAGQGGAVCVSELVGRMHGTPPAVSRSLRLLEAEGLVRRYADPADRRRTLVEITEKGDALRRQCERQLCRYLERVIGRLGAEKLHRMMADWELLEQAMDTEAGALAQRAEK